MGGRVGVMGIWLCCDCGGCGALRGRFVGGGSGALLRWSINGVSIFAIQRVLGGLRFRCSGVRRNSVNGVLGLTWLVGDSLLCSKRGV